MDYNSLVTTVNSLIAEHGTTVKLYKSARVNADPLKPWKINEAGTDPVPTVVTSGINLGKSASELGFKHLSNEQIKSIKRVFFVAPGTGPYAEDFEDFNFIEIDSVKYTMSLIDKLKPANKTLLYYIGIDR